MSWGLYTFAPATLGEALACIGAVHTIRECAGATIAWRAAHDSPDLASLVDCAEQWIVIPGVLDRRARS